MDCVCVVNQRRRQDFISATNQIQSSTSILESFRVKTFREGYPEGNLILSNKSYTHWIRTCCKVYGHIYTEKYNMEIKERLLISKQSFVSFEAGLAMALGDLTRLTSTACLWFAKYNINSELMIGCRDRR